MLKLTQNCNQPILKHQSNKTNKLIKQFHVKYCVQVDSLQLNRLWFKFSHQRPQRKVQENTYVTEKT
jgi:hypothetical protein